MKPIWVYCMIDITVGMLNSEVVEIKSPLPHSFEFLHGHLSIANGVSRSRRYPSQSTQVVENTLASRAPHGLYQSQSDHLWVICNPCCNSRKNLPCISVCTNNIYPFSPRRFERT